MSASDDQQRPPSLASALEWGIFVLVALLFAAGLLGHGWFIGMLLLGGVALMLGGGMVAADYHGVAGQLRARALRDERRAPPWWRALGRAERSPVAWRLQGVLVASFGLMLISSPMATLSQHVGQVVFDVGGVAAVLSVFAAIVVSRTC